MQQTPSKTVVGYRNKTKTSSKPLGFSMVLLCFLLYSLVAFESLEHFWPPAASLGCLFFHVASDQRALQAAIKLAPHAVNAMGCLL